MNCSTNVLTTSENSCGEFVTTWPDLTFWNITFFTVPPTPSIGPFPWWRLLYNYIRDLLGKWYQPKYKTWSKLSSHPVNPVTPHAQILIVFTVLTFNFMNNFFQTTHWSHYIMIWYFTDNNNVIVLDISLNVKIATPCKNAEASITKIDTLNDILLLIFVTLCKVNLDHKVVWAERSLHFLIHIDLPSFDVNMFF